MVALDVVSSTTDCIWLRANLSFDLKIYPSTRSFHVLHPITQGVASIPLPGNGKRECWVLTHCGEPLNKGVVVHVSLAAIAWKT